jgi:hypothetical protein
VTPLQIRRHLITAAPSHNPKDQLPTMSAAEERIWNSLATGMDRFHSHFRYEFDMIYRVRTWSLFPVAPMRVDVGSR